MREDLRDIFYKEYVEKVTEKPFLKRIKVSKADMLAYMRGEGRKAQIFSILDKEEIKCRDVLDMCCDFMENRWGKPENGWLDYIYYHLVSGLYPEYTDDPEYFRDSRYEPAVFFYLETLRLFLAFEKENTAFDYLKNFDFVPKEEAGRFSGVKEYAHLTDLFEKHYIYEMMRISREVTVFNILSHIAGVHYVAMHVSRQLYEAGTPIDLTVISGAALGHDIGKFGCKPSEAGRVPYLHYYYTDQWFRRNDMPSVGHIATNHSAWDLELENLPLESLVLIYADFRVKNKYKDNGKNGGIPSRETIEFFTLEQSFDVILNKLDNVDAYKYQRYRIVYEKLHDFEQYMESLGVNTDLCSRERKEIKVKDPALRTKDEVIQSLKYLAIEHNIRIMSKINDEAAFANILEAARSEKNWKNLRAYVNILTEYVTYMTQRQKELVLAFLYELLMYREGDIRRQAAALLGVIIIGYDVKYRKEIPADVNMPENTIRGPVLWAKYLRLILFPGHKVTDQHRRWIGYALKIVVDAALKYCPEEEKGEYLAIFLQHFQDTQADDLTIFILLDAMLYIPLETCRREDLMPLVHFATRAVFRDSLEIQVSALHFLRFAIEDIKRQRIDVSVIQKWLMDFHDEDEVGIHYLKYCILKKVGMSEELENQYNISLFYRKPSPVSAIFLNNLKIATPWVLKIINIEFLLEILKRNQTDALHVATHLSNLLKVSERVAVRHRAGEALLLVAPLLTSDQCNEIVIELMKGLEIGDYAVSKYIPEYLGEIALYLPPGELDELLSDIKNLLKGTNEKVATGALNTLSVLLEHDALYRSRYEESDEVFEKRRRTILGMILSGLANYNEHVSQEAFLVLGKTIFGSKILSLQSLYEIFRLIYKKLLTLIFREEPNDLALFNSAAALNHIYRFISDYILSYGAFEMDESKRVAYFPGTFDPFSLSHKGIVQEIRDQGFEVFLALDEFSWSKRTQPRLVRWQIVNMSVADEFDVYLFPDEIPVNISNDEDLRHLKEIFSEKELYFVAGSDVVMNASAYKLPPTADSVHSLNHVVFRRSTLVYDKEVESEMIREKIRGQLIELKLPLHLEDISSTVIREHIDLGRDISNLIDPLAQNYIYDLGLYLREPQYKTVLKTRSVRFELLQAEKAFSFLNKFGISHKKGKKPYVMTILDGDEEGGILGFAFYHEVTTSDLYDEFGSPSVSEYVRSRAAGKIVVIHQIHAKPDAAHTNVRQWVLAEMLAYCLAHNITYCLYAGQDQNDKAAVETLERQGFSAITNDEEEMAIYAVNMAAPIVVIKDVEQALKEPFKTNEKVQAVIEASHQRLQKALVQTYPGNLVLSFDMGIMHHGIISKVTEINEVPATPLPVRKLGRKICVPFGKILRGVAVPNTVTKSLHTEKMFDARIRRFRIEAYPFYSPLANQVRTIRSFRRDVVLVDDILHKGYRLKELDPIFKAENLPIDRIVVGIMSGRGKDLMRIQGRKAESVYYIPNLKIWFTESALYPFIGGDSVKRGNMIKSGAPPSINLILPYVSPNFIRGTGLKELFHLSGTCLENTRELLGVLEDEYRKSYERNLTLNRLGEVMMYPGCPDTGNQIKYDYSLPPSVYIENDIERLTRLLGLIR